jgi:hypothetical protein
MPSAYISGIKRKCHLTSINGWRDFLVFDNGGVPSYSYAFLDKSNTCFD